MPTDRILDPVDRHGEVTIVLPGSDDPITASRRQLERRERWAAGIGFAFARGRGAKRRAARGPTPIFAARCCWRRLHSQWPVAAAGEPDEQRHAPPHHRARSVRSLHPMSKIIMLPPLQIKKAVRRSKASTPFRSTMQTNGICASVRSRADLAADGDADRGCQRDRARWQPLRCSTTPTRRSSRCAPQRSSRKRKPWDRRSTNSALGAAQTIGIVGGEVLVVDGRGRERRAIDVARSCQ